MVYSTTFLSLLLATTAALPMPDNEGVGHGVGARLQVMSTGRNSLASHEAKLDAQLEIQDALARTQSVGSAATIPGEATIFGKHIPEPSVLAEAEKRCEGKGNLQYCKNECEPDHSYSYGSTNPDEYFFHRYGDKNYDSMEDCEAQRCIKCSGPNHCPCPPPKDCQLFGCYVDLTSKMVCPARATADQRATIWGEYARTWYGFSCPYQIPGNWRWIPMCGAKACVHGEAPPTGSNGTVTECTRPIKGAKGYGTNDVYDPEKWNTCTEAHKGRLRAFEYLAATDKMDKTHKTDKTHKMYKTDKTHKTDAMVFASEFPVHSGQITPTKISKQ